MAFLLTLTAFPVGAFPQADAVKGMPATSRAALEVHCKTSFFPPPLPPEIQGTEEGTQRGGWTIPADRGRG